MTGSCRKPSTNRMGCDRMEKNTEKKPLQKILGMIATTCMVGIFLLVLLVFVQVIKNPGQSPSILGYKPLTVLSNSMDPAFETGDLIFVKKTDASAIEVGDVITFQAKGEPLITHRVEEIIDDQNGISFITKGDNNNVADDMPVTADMLQGKQVFHIPNLGFIAKFASGSKGVIFLIIIPLIGYVALEIWERTKKVKPEH